MSVSFVCTALTVAVFGADAPAPEVLPAPREVIVESFPGYYRRSHYAVWQAYSPNLEGVWVPRIDYVPGDGYYYVRTGKPAPWAQQYQRWVRPSLRGTPYQLPPPAVIYYVLPDPPPARPEEEDED